MKTDEIYRFIGYAVVVVFIIYLVSSAFRFQTGVLVEGFMGKKKSSRSSSSSVGDGGYTGTANDLKSLCEIEKVDKLKRSQEENFVSQLVRITKKFEDSTCKRYGNVIKYYSNRKVNKEVNLLYDICIDRQKLELAVEGTSFAKLYIDDEAREEAMERINTMFNSINAFKYSKKCYNEIFNN